MDEQQVINEIFLWINRIEESILEESNDPEAIQMLEELGQDPENLKLLEPYELAWKQLQRSGKPILTYEVYEAEKHNVILPSFYDEWDFYKCSGEYFFNKGYELPIEGSVGFDEIADNYEFCKPYNYFNLLKYMTLKAKANHNSEARELLELMEFLLTPSEYYDDDCYDDPDEYYSLEEDVADQQLNNFEYQSDPNPGSADDE